MDYLQKFLSQFRIRLFLMLLLGEILAGLSWLLVSGVFKLTGYQLVMAACIVPIVSLIFLPWLAAKYLTEPTRLIWQAILHVAPGDNQVAAPKAKSKFGRELVQSLSAQLYQMSEVAKNVASNLEKQNANLAKNPVASLLPLPLFIINANQVIAFANEAAIKYIGSTPDATFGQNVYNLLDMSFKEGDTLDSWLEQCRLKTVTASRTWNRVRLKLPKSGKTLEFDMAAYYNKAAASGYELMLVMFDHTNEYSGDEHSFNFVALTVHELRTPLTLLRGYIEALEEDVSSSLPKTDQVFMQRLVAAGQQLAAVVNNILNVARIEDDQFLVQLKSEQWPDIIKQAVGDLQLRASVHDIKIETQIAPDLPPVAADKVSMYEVISNLLDNAIKYSGGSKKISLKSVKTSDGFVETTVQDFGVGIPEAVIPNLFDRFYRSHVTRDQIGGTGLGLYLCKTIVNAHGGHIWARSQEGRGSIFGFTLLPYDKVQATREDPQGLTRTASGWIKNHSLYRR